MTGTVLRVGVVATGALGSHHARVVAGLSEAKLSSVYDLDPGRAQAAGDPFGAPVAKDLVPTLPRGIMQLPANGSSRILASKQRKVNIALWAYADSHMGDATSPPCCYSFTHDT